ncbi:hypothetical protein KIF59_02675 [Enterobacter cloacae subsp. cloacae]|nr:hypothetical protein [Enterobacter cloacae subsp. cloacae]
MIAVNQLADVVNEASQTNLFKDYFYACFRSHTFVNHCIYHRYTWLSNSRRPQKNERMKADTLNSIVLKMQSMQASLIATKQNYFESLGSHPIQRALNVPIMPNRLEYANFAANELAQLLYTKNHDIDKYPWMNSILRVNVSGNFNMFIENSKKKIRNELDKKQKHQLSSFDCWLRC